MKRFLLIVPFLFTMNSNAKVLHALGGAAVGYAIGKSGSSSANPVYNTTTTTASNYNNTLTFRCFCKEKMRFGSNQLYCINENTDKSWRTTDILFFQENNAPNIIVAPLKTKPYNTQGCEVVNN
jgi:hypothetical protein